MVTIVNRAPNWADALGTGIGTGIQRLAQQKLQHIEQQRSESNLIKSGVDPQDSRLLSLFSHVPAVQAKMLESLWQRGANAPTQDPNMPPQDQEISRTPAAGQSNLYRVPLKEQRANEELKLKKLKAIESQNKPFLDRFAKQKDNASEIHRIASELKDILESGQVTSGVAGLRPRFLMGDASRRAAAKMDELASKLAGQSGVATGFKIKFAQGIKPSLDMPAKTQLDLTNDILNQTGDILLRGDAIDDLVSKGDIANLEQMSKNKFKVYKKALSKMPSPIGYPEGTIGREPETKIVFIIEDGKWSPYSGDIPERE